MQLAVKQFHKQRYRGGKKNIRVNFKKNKWNKRGILTSAMVYEVYLEKIQLEKTIF